MINAEQTEKPIPEDELRADSWERFEGAVDAALHTRPKHREKASSGKSQNATISEKPETRRRIEKAIGVLFLGLMIGSTAHAETYPALYQDQITAACLSSAPSRFQSHGVQFSPGGARTYCACLLEVSERMMPLSDYTGSESLVADIKAGNPLTDHEQTQLAEIRSLGQETARSCGCYIRTAQNMPYQELSKAPAECPN